MHSIKTLLDLNTLSLEGLVGRLCATEDRGDEEEETNGPGRLFLIEERWEVRRCQCAGKDHVGNGDDGRRGNRRDDDDGSNKISSGVSRHHHSSGKGRCFNCSGGHFSWECTRPRKEEALLANVDDEPTLLLDRWLPIWANNWYQSWTDNLSSCT
jgi:hypothetical protein